jgi:YVTN family beta-propeller protein
MHVMGTFKTATDSVTDSIMLLSSLSSSALRPDGKMLYVSEGDHEVTVIDTAAKMVKAHIDIGGQGLDFAVANVVLATPTAEPSQETSPAPSRGASIEPQPSGQVPSQSTGSPEVSSGILPTPTAALNQTPDNTSSASASPTTSGFEILLAVLGILGVTYILIKKRLK